jgi:hypothetical protein
VVSSAADSIAVSAISCAECRSAIGVNCVCIPSLASAASISSLFTASREVAGKQLLPSNTRCRSLLRGSNSAAGGLASPPKGSNSLYARYLSLTFAGIGLQQGLDA